MEEIQYKKAYTEVYEIINNLEKELKEKIPKKFIKFIDENRQKDYKFKFNKNIDIESQDLLNETQILLAIIYRDYLCTEDEKKEINKIMNENEIKHKKELEKKYDIEKIFQKKDNKEETNECENKNKSENLQLQEYKPKQNIFKRLINSIIKFFKINSK